jgi:pyruvyltransferase
MVIEEPRVTAYSWQVISNFGDMLTPFMLRHFCDVRPTWARPEWAEVVLSGSVIDHLPDGYGGIVLGTGQLHEETRRDLRNATVLGLRGPLTAERTQTANKDYVLGDIGLLSAEMVAVEPGRWRIGVVPHHADPDLYEREWDRSVKAKYDRPILIDPTHHPREVIEKIGSCERIVTSSLHGAVVSDAFGIPRRMEMSPHMDDPWEGGAFKYLDYHASIGLPLVWGKLQRADSERIQMIQSDLFGAMMQLRGLLNA